MLILLYHARKYQILNHHLLWTTVDVLIVVTEMLTDDWQVYCRPWEVWRGLNVRLPLDTVMPFPLVTTPVEFLHVTTGVSELFPTSVPVQVSVYICPATGVPEVVMFTVCTETEVKKIYDENSYRQCSLSTQNGGVPFHWSSDVLCVTGSDWCPTDIGPSISSPQGSQHQCALVGWSSPWRITTTEGSSPWCSPCIVHHHCTVHWWVQLDITGQGDIVSNGYHLTGYSSDGCSRRGDCNGHLG